MIACYRSSTLPSKWRRKAGRSTASVSKGACSLEQASVETLVDRGHPALKIIERAKESGRTLILMGTQGKGFVEELFLGSVAHGVPSYTPGRALRAGGGERKASQRVTHECVESE
ncbi:MAG: universal stress protein [Terrimicrobiaceae bacterium]